MICCQVQSPPGTVIGYLEQNWTLCTPSFAVKNELGQEVRLELVQDTGAVTFQLEDKVNLQPVIVIVISCYHLL